MWAHKEGRQPEHKAIERSEIGRASPGLAADQKLMLEQDGLSCKPSHASRAEQFREGNEQMDRQDEQIAHEGKIITAANLHKTAPGSDLCWRWRAREPIDQTQSCFKLNRIM